MSSCFFLSFCLGKNCFVTVIPHREHLVPPRQPTISAVQLGRTVPISPEGCPPATPSTLASSGEHETSRALRTTELPPPLPYHMGTASNEDLQLLASSASSPPSLCAGETDRVFDKSLDWREAGKKDRNPWFLEVLTTPEARWRVVWGWVWWMLGIFSSYRWISWWWKRTEWDLKTKRKTSTLTHQHILTPSAEGRFIGVRQYIQLPYRNRLKLLSASDQTAFQVVLYWHAHIILSKFHPQVQISISQSKHRHSPQSQHESQLI